MQGVRENSMKKKFWSILWLLLVLSLFTGCSTNDSKKENVTTIATTIESESTTSQETGVASESVVAGESVKTGLEAFDLSSVPGYQGSPWCEINGGNPFFTQDEMTTQSYERYGELDALGRCQTCMASIGTDLMPTTERGNIGNVHPTGWHLVKYAGINGNYLYNRCHLIGYQLTAENANTRNLITGTRYLNVDGMLPWENKTADYIKNTGNHVMYRVTPIFEGSNLLASGVLMEGKSVEDNGAGLSFCVYCYNVQPGITIDYATGDSSGPEFTGSGSKK
jgi:DNA-entry nuclease